MRHTVRLCDCVERNVFESSSRRTVRSVLRLASAHSSADGINVGCERIEAVCLSSHLLAKLLAFLDCPS